MLLKKVYFRQTISRRMVLLVVTERRLQGRLFLPEAAEKSSDARHPKFRGMRRIQRYAAMTRDEDNAEDGDFSAAS